MQTLLKTFRRVAWVGCVAWASCGLSVAAADELAAGFQRPPDSAKPWTYWFWMNGNLTREGITADLEAMARVGIHGVLIMDVARPKQMAPAGPVPFGTPAWYALLRHAIAEAGRLGMEINLNNDAGWTGSGGPWVPPELSMQKLVWTNTTVQGPSAWEGVLPAPQAVRWFYRDIKVLAYPASAESRPAPAKKKAAAKANPAPAAVEPPIPAEQIVDLSAKMDATGKLQWNVPAGKWLVKRIGHTSTGRVNHPAPESGTGLECDKFSAEAVTQHFESFIGHVVEMAGPAAGKVLSSTHIDSWEVGVQDWTPRMAEEFARRRGYDLTPWLVWLAGGQPVGSADLTRRFQRDFKRTQSELNSEVYAGTMRALANRRGIALSIEAYGPTGDFINSLDYATHADVPMAEFWVMRWAAWHLHSARLVSSAVHAAGRAIVGAESFTATGENGSWTEHPYSIKTVGDWAFSEGVNRFVFHRTAMQPWSGYEPGMTFGPHGTHFDRNQTWWEPGAAFMQYLTRCQFLLQQGGFVADVCRLLPDGEEHGSSENHGSSRGMMTLPGRFAALPVGYNHDYVSDKLLSEGATVKDGRITFPGGMSYRVMQLPETTSLTPELLAKIRDLVRQGAVVAGPRPETSPSLRDYPRADAEVKRLAAEMWGDCNGKTVTQHRLGAGRVCWGRPMADVLRESVGEPDLQFALDPGISDEAIMSVTLGAGKPMGKEPGGLMPTAGLNWLHRRTPEAEIYFLANPQHRPVEARCTFRVAGRQPELWNPETGDMIETAVFATRDGATELPLHFTPAGSVFVVFRNPAKPAAQVVGLSRDGRELLGPSGRAAETLPRVKVSGSAGIELETSVAGSYRAALANGQSRRVVVEPLPPPIAVGGPWAIRFQPGRGAPASAVFPALVDWTAQADDGIRHFSGTATYAAEFVWRGPAQPDCAWQLDLGRVEVIAEVRLNGVDLGVLWKPPFTVDVTRALQPGRNQLEVKVTNLWVNRLVGDERYPDDCTPGGTWKTGPIPEWPEWFVKGRPRPEPRRLTFTTWKYYTADTPLLPSGLIGPVTFQPRRQVELK